MPKKSGFILKSIENGTQNTIDIHIENRQSLYWKTMEIARHKYTIHHKVNNICLFVYYLFICLFVCLHNKISIWDKNCSDALQIVFCMFFYECLPFGRKTLYMQLQYYITLDFHRNCIFLIFYWFNPFERSVVCLFICLFVLKSIFVCLLRWLMDKKCHRQSL